MEIMSIGNLRIAIPFESFAPAAVDQVPCLPCSCLLMFCSQIDIFTKTIDLQN